MSQYKFIACERAGEIATLIFNRPEKLNALSSELIAEALGASEEIAKSKARVLIVTGAGRSFSAGVDFEVFSRTGFSRDDAKRFSDDARALARLWEEMPQAVIAKVSGYCMTGALELALACDLIVASDSAQFGDTHAKIGLRPGWGLSQRLPRRIGSQRAKEMSFTARKIGAEEATRIGLILEAVPSDRLDTRVEELAQMVITNSAGSIAAYKQLYRKSQNQTLDEGLLYESLVNFRIEDARERQSGLSKPKAR